MSETMKLTLSLEKRPWQIAIVAHNLNHDDWYRISLLLASATPPVGEPLVIQPERLLQERRSLQELLVELKIELEADKGVTRLLQRSIRDQRSFNHAIQGVPLEVTDSGENHDPTRSMKRVLHPFQARDFELLRRMQHGANFSVPGAGKTTVTYALHARERAAGRASKLLVVAPLSAFSAWEEDVTEVLDPPLSVGRWRGGPLPTTDVILVNYQRLPAAMDQLADLMLQHPTHLVVDEAHRAKRGSAGAWGRVLVGLAPLAARRDVLTGTPAPNQPRDLVAILDILWPGGVARQAVPAALRRNDPSSTEMRALNKIVAPLYARTTKNELGLRDPRIILDPVPMSDLQQQIYDAMLDRYAGTFDLGRRDAAMFAQMGEIAMYLLQASSSPRLLSAKGDPARSYRYPSLAVAPGSRLAGLIESYVDHEIPAKLERAFRIIESNVKSDRKTLVWSNFPGNLRDLELMLSGLNPAVIYGAIPSDDEAMPGVRTRERELARFRFESDCRVLLANPAAMSEGVSLHHWCNDAIYIDRTFNAGQYLQSVDRIHRLGLLDHVETRITILTSKGTIDERVNSRVADKTRRLATMLNDPVLVQMALPDDEDPGEVSYDELDLAEVLDHLKRGPRRPLVDE